MLNLECVEQSKECRGSKWGRLLPISNLGSQHYSGVTTGGTAACTAGAPTRTTEDQCTSAGACLGRPIVIGLLGCSVATESFLS